MPDMIETTIAETEKQLAALKEVASKYPGCYCRTHGDYISVWVVDMPHSECDQVQMVNHTFDPYERRTVRSDGYVIIFKNIGPGVNIAPKGHHISLDLYLHYTMKKPRTMQALIKIFEEKAT